MICKNCGTENLPGSRFCENCGSPLEAAPEVVTAAPAEETIAAPAATPRVEPAAAPVETAAAAPETAPAKQKKKKASFIDRLKKGDIKAIIPCAAALVALIAIIVVLAAALKPAEYELTKTASYIGEYDDNLVVVNSKGKTLKIDAEDYSSSTSMDGSKAAICTSDEDSILYYYNGSKLTKVAEEVWSFRISGNGKTVFYFVESDDEGYDLYLYNGKKSTKLASEVASTITVAPDGSAAFRGISDEDGDFVGYFYDGKVREIGKNKAPFAISNGAKYVYYEKEGTAYVQKKDKDDTRQKLCEGIRNYYLNKDGSEILYTDGDKTYVSVNGKEKIKVAGSPMSPIMIANTQYYGSFRGVSTFKGKFLYNSGDAKIVRVTRKYATESVVSNVSSYTLLSDGKTIVFLKSDNLKKINGKKANAEAVKLTDDDVLYFICSYDGKSVFYVNEDKELFVAKGSKPKRVTDDFDDIEALFQGSKLIYTLDDEAFMYAGGKTTKLSAGDEVRNVWANRWFIILADQDSEYFSTNGSKFTKLGDY